MAANFPLPLETLAISSLVTAGELASLSPSPLPFLPPLLTKDLSLIFLSGPG